MTWGEIELLSIQKMFLNTDSITTDDLTSMKTNKKYAIYLNAMPATANEAIRIILTRGKSYIKVYQLSGSDADPDTSNDDVYCFDLSDVLDDYKSLERVYKDVEDYKGYVIRFNRYLYLPKDLVDNKSLSIGYSSYPKKITSATSDNYKIDLPLDMLNLLPLYIASELYKDDDISLATVYRNEFEVELENLNRDADHEEFTSINGWL